MQCKACIFCTCWICFIWENKKSIDLHSFLVKWNADVSANIGLMDFFVKFFVKVRTQLNFPGCSKELNQSTKNVMEIIHQQSLIVQTKCTHKSFVHTVYKR